MEQPGGRARKRLVVCCDGTWNRPDVENVTNVEKIARTVETDLRRTEGVQQLVLYLSGVGTGAYAADRWLGGAFGLGLFANVRSGYRFLALNYEPGDEIFVFGFSRGAYTARSLAGMIGRVGLLTREALVADRLGRAVGHYRAPHGPGADESAAQFRQRYCHPETAITMLGVFDTVGALGVPGALRRRQQFHDVRLGPVVRRARQALALDELRRTFEPCLWTAEDEERRSDEVSGRVEQVWFPGVHADIGGGYPDSGLSDTTLLWMTDEATRLGLVFDLRLLEVYLRCGRPARVNASLTPAYRVLNALARGRRRARGRADAFVHGWRRLDSDRPVAGERAVGVRVASTAVALFDADPGYRHPHLVQYAQLTHGFSGRSQEVVALPEDGVLQPAGTRGWTLTRRAVRRAGRVPAQRRAGSRSSRTGSVSRP